MYYIPGSDFYFRISCLVFSDVERYLAFWVFGHNFEVSGYTLVFYHFSEFFNAFSRLFLLIMFNKLN